jgi:cell division transport system permease protein
VIFHLLFRLSRRAAVNLWRAPLPSLVSILTIALALSLGAAFVLGAFAARALFRSWGTQAAVTLYLDRALTDAQGRAVAQQAQAQAGDAAVAYVDRPTALLRLRQDLGDLASSLDGLSEDPLPPTVEVTPRTLLSPSALRLLSGRLAQLPGVQEVDYGREWLDKLEALGSASRAFGAGTFVAVLGAALLVVANTIRLAVYARRDEIEIMKLVGATDGYVRAPFLLEGLFQGLLGAGLAVLAVLSLQRWLLPRVQAAFAFAAGAVPPRILPVHAAALLGMGAVVGLLGSWLAVGRFLRT